MVKGVSIGDRMKKLRKKHALSQARVAEKLFVSQAAYSFMENSRHGLSSEHTIQLCQLYNITADYLLRGNKNLVEMSVKNGFLPLLNEKAHAGIIKAIDQNDLDEGFEYYKIPGFNPTADGVLIEIEGNSMQPTILSGDILVCQRQKNLDYVLDGSIAVVVTDGGLLTKRIFKHPDKDYFWLASDNPDDDQKRKINKSDIKKMLMVLGKVSNVLVPYREMAFKGKMRSIQESLEALGNEVYDLNKKLNSVIAK